MAKRSQRGFKPQSSSPAEWVVAALGSLIVIATVSYLLYSEFTGGPSHPMISVIEQAVEYPGREYLVRFWVRNSGGTTAAHVHVKGELLEGDKTLESSEVTFDYVPAFSSRIGDLFFTHDPSKAQLQLRPVSFREP
jgi:uncharacterized protein (TIGR02588 family)